MVRYIGLNIIALVFSFTVFGQDEFVELKIEPLTVELGQPFTVTIKTNVNGNIQMNLPDEFVQSGPRQSGMSSSIKDINGHRKAVRFSFESFSGSITKKGRYLFGPAKIVDNNGKEYKSDSYTVQIIEPKNMISDDPSKNLDKLAFGIIQQSDKEIYEGQSIVVEGKVYSKVDVMQVTDYSPFTFSGPADSRTLDPSNRVSVNYEVVSGKKLQTFNIGKTLIFPEKVGEYVIQPFQTTVVYNDPRKFFPDQLKIVSNTATVNVKPLPSGIPKNFIDGVGKFKVIASVDKTNIVQGKVIELRVQIKGEGNIQNIKKPKINLPKNLSFYGDPEVKDSIYYSSVGAEGSKTFLYYIQVNRVGDIQLDPIKIAYFNPIAERYETSECKIKPIYAQSNGTDIQNNSKPSKEGSQEPVMQPYIAEVEEDNENWTDFFGGWKGSLILFSPIMLGAIVGVGFRMKKQNEESNLDKKLRVQHKFDALAQLDLLENNKDSNQVIELTQVLIHFLAKQFKADNGEITRAYLHEKVPNEIPPEVYADIIFVFNELDTIKYAGKMNNEGRMHLIDEVKQIINSF